MNGLYLALGAVAVFGLVIWLGMRAARKQGEAEGKTDDAKSTADAQKRMADADARGPRTGADVVRRLRDRSF